MLMQVENLQGTVVPVSLRDVDVDRHFAYFDPQGFMVFGQVRSIGGDGGVRIKIERPDGKISCFFYSFPKIPGRKLERQSRRDGFKDLDPSTPVFFVDPDHVVDGLRKLKG